MGQRNMLCSNQMLDLQSDQGHSYLHPDHCIFSSSTINYDNQNVHHLLSASGNMTESHLQFRGHNNTFYGNQYNHIQNCHAVPNLGLGAAAPSSFYNPCMIPISSGRILSIPQENGSSYPFSSSISQRNIGISMDEFGRNNQFVGSIGGSYKRKNLEMASENCYSVNGMASSSSSSNWGWPQLGHLHASGPNLVDATNYIPNEHQDRGTILTSTASHASAANNAWMTQPRNGNSNGDGGCSNWNYTHAITYLNWRCIPSRTVEMTNIGLPSCHDALSRANSAILLHPAALPNFHQPLSHVQRVQVQNYHSRMQIPTPSYQHPLNNLHLLSVNPSSGSLDSAFRFRHFQSSAEQMYRPQQLHHIAPEFGHGNLRILTSEDAAVMELSRFYGAGNMIDQHQDMRLDIDEMSYEEILALEEQIGDVNTGLTEEYIIKNLKTSTNASETSLSLRLQENEACIICQDEYKENETTATLDCGHIYHGECIKQWLLVKNLCPICKISALAADKRDGLGSLKE